jgi:hypothetical protein
MTKLQPIDIAFIIILFSIALCSLVIIFKNKKGNYNIIGKGFPLKHFSESSIIKLNNIAINELIKLNSCEFIYNNNYCIFKSSAKFFRKTFRSPTPLIGILYINHKIISVTLYSYIITDLYLLVFYIYAIIKTSVTPGMPKFLPIFIFTIVFVVFYIVSYFIEKYYIMNAYEEMKNYLTK